MTTPIEVSALNSHEKKRWRRLWQAILSDGFSRALAAVANLIQVPIALNYLGREGFGLWVVLVGSVQMFGFADLGMALGLQNEVSDAYGRDDMQAVRNLFVTGVKLLAIVSLGVVALFCALTFAVNWADLFKVQAANLRNSMSFAASIAVGGFCLGLPLIAGARTATGLQMGWLVGLMNSAGSLLTLGAVIVSATLHLGFLQFLVFAVSVPILVNGTTTIIMMSIVRRSTTSSGRFDRAGATRILKKGVLFLVPQACASISNAAPAAVITAVAGPSVSSIYIVCQRLAGAAMQLQQMPLGPLWPAYAEAKGRGDYVWIRTTFRRSMRYATVVGLGASLFIGLFGGKVILAWTGKADVVPTGGLLFVTAGWVFLISIGNALAPFLNGIGYLKSQAVAGAIALGLALVAMPAAVRAFGATGAMLALTVTYGTIAIPAVALSARNRLRLLGTDTRQDSRRSEHRADPLPTNATTAAQYRR